MHTSKLNDRLPDREQFDAAGSLPGESRCVRHNFRPARREILQAQRDVELLLGRIDEPEPLDRIEARKQYSLSSSRKLRDGNTDEYFVLARGAQTGRAVARLFVRSPGAGRAYGTGFLVGPGLLLTNNHVIPDAGHALDTVASFDYELDVRGELRRAQNFRVSGEVFLTSETLDYTLVSIQPVSTEGVPLSDYGWIPLLPKSGKALKKEVVNVIHHPGGDLKKVALRQSTMIGVQDDFMYCITDTQPGSSGSPVFNVEWQVAALHHAAIPDKDDPERFTASRGVRVSSILTDIGNRRDWGDRQAIEIDRRLQEGRLALSGGTVVESGAPRADRSGSIAQARAVTSDEPHAMLVDFKTGGWKYYDNALRQRPRNSALLRARGHRGWRTSWA